MMNMSSEFETKQLATETLGEYLQRVRTALRLSITEVSKKTGIFEKFLISLEAGKYEKLPPDVYVLGFIKKLSVAYAIPFQPMQEQFRKERDILEHEMRQKIEPKRSLRDLVKEVSLTPKTISVIGVVLVLVISFVYLMVQIFSVNKTPTLQIDEPKPDTVISGSSVVVKGQTDFGSTLTINGQNVFVKNDGEFQTLAGVTPGQTELRVDSVNKFGKRSSQIISLRVEEPAKEEIIQTKEDKIQLSIKFLQDTTIALIKDGVQIPSEVIPAGAIKNILASDTVVLTTNDAGSTEVTLNGKLLGVLGKVGETMTVPFGSETMQVLE